MSLFDKLFARAPKLPDPVYDLLGGDAAMGRALDDLKVGKWRDADDLLAHAKKGDQRAARAGHIALAAEGWPAWIDDWHAARKERSEPWLIRGAVRMGWAWAVRGSGRADEVEEDAWPVFHERLREAEADLLEASRRDESDATPWAYLLASGAALDMGVPELLERFDQARKRDPEGWLAPWQALNALSEKWSGSHDVMFALAREASANGSDASQLHALVAEAHLHRWQYFSMENPPDPKGQARYYDDDNVQRELARAWERGPGSSRFKPGPFGTGQIALFAFGFSLGEDKDLARAAFEKLNNRLTRTPWGHLGDPMEVFVQFRDAALR
jgi:hypothetical protein